MASTTRRKVIRSRTPIPGSLRSMNPDYPIKPRILPPTEESVTVVCVQQRNGKYLATLAENQKISFESVDRKAAEDSVLRLYQALRRKPIDRRTIEDLEEDEDVRVIQQRKHEPTVPLEEVLAQYGRLERTIRKKSAKGTRRVS